jgi:spore maturation protein CgeB
LLSRALVREYNELVLDAAEWFKPDLLLAFKGNYLESSTLRALRQRSVLTYNYYPDPSPFAYDSVFAESLFEYDCVFYTKRYWEKEPFINKFKNHAFVPHGYDPEIHRPQNLRSEELAEYRHDVAVVATYSPHKEELLDSLLVLMPSLDLAIWGNGWRDSCRSQRVTSFLRGHAINGAAYAQVLSAARINLAIVQGIVHRGVRQYDETTTRTYEIPACRGFMLHERSDELHSLFDEDSEVVCFDSPHELAAKIEHYLAHPIERAAIARAGYVRCVPAYSYDTRMAEILAWHTRYYDQRP